MDRSQRIISYTLFWSFWAIYILGAIGTLGMLYSIPPPIATALRMFSMRSAG